MGGQGRFVITNGKLVQFLGRVKDVIIPDDVVEIGAGAFRGYDVESVYIPDGVISIGENCFNGCKKLRTVRVPASVKKIGENAFKDTSGVKIIAAKGTYAWEYAFNNLSGNILPEKNNEAIKKTSPYVTTINVDMAKVKSSASSLAKELQSIKESSVETTTASLNSNINKKR